LVWGYAFGICHLHCNWDYDPYCLCYCLTSCYHRSSCCVALSCPRNFCLLKTHGFMNKFYFCHTFPLT
jgi:hypothetical protein